MLPCGGVILNMMYGVIFSPVCGPWGHTKRSTQIASNGLKQALYKEKTNGNMEIVRLVNGYIRTLEENIFQFLANSLDKSTFTVDLYKFTLQSFEFGQGHLETV